MGEKLKVLDLFSGIGGFALGLEAAGMEPAAFCEVAPSCRHLLATHWPEVPCYDDVKTLTGERLAADGIRVDALCGGFPCQDLSYAGKGAGLAGERSGLWFQIARILRELRDLGRPVRIVILENVSALLGRGLGVVLGDLAALGYDAEWDCIPASSVGAPHRRDRIWIVAYARGVEHEGFGDAFRRALAPELLGTAVADTDCGLHQGELDQGANLSQASRSEGGDSSQGQAPHRKRVRAQPRASRPVLAYTDGERREERDLTAVASGPGQCGRIAYPSRREWLSEPDVGRVAHGVPAELDGVHVHYEKEHDPQGCAQGDGEGNRLPGVRSLGTAATASPELPDAGCGRGALSSLSCEGRPSRWDQEGEGAEELHDLRSGVRADAQQEAHDLQSRVPVGGGAPKLSKALGWAFEPDVPRVAHGVPARVDRLHGLGNAVVPQIPEILGRAILSALQSQRAAA